MHNIKIIADTTASLPIEYIEKENITVFPIYYTFEGKEYAEGYPHEYKDFYEKLINSQNFPQTSQPSIQKMKDCLEEALEEEPDAIIVLSISKGLSGTFNSLNLVADMIGDDRIHIFDTRTTTVNLKRQVEYVVKLRNENKNIDEIIEKLNKHREEEYIYFIPETLEYLKRGGRLSAASAFIGDMLSIKPIVTVTPEGTLDVYEKVRGSKKGINKMLSYIPDDVKYLSVVYIYDNRKSITIAENLKEKYPDIDIYVEEVDPVIGCHIGPGTIGILYGTYL